MGCYVVRLNFISLSAYQATHSKLEQKQRRQARTHTDTAYFHHHQRLSASCMGEGFWSTEEEEEEEEEGRYVIFRRRRKGKKGECKQSFIMPCLSISERP